VGELVEQVRGGGLDASLAVTGKPSELAPGLDMSAYRIVREAVTNALRHAPGARVSVKVEYGRELVLEVLDDGARRANRHGGTARLRPRARRHARAHGAVRRLDRSRPARRRRRRGPGEAAATSTGS
jgi:signal transduction histidine kinase